MSTTPQNKIALYASIVIGAASGPFLFKAAGFSDFPKFQFSHYMITICYVVGATKISMFIFQKLLSACPTSAPEEKMGAEQGADGNPH